MHSSYTAYQSADTPLQPDPHVSLIVLPTPPVAPVPPPLTMKDVVQIFVVALVCIIIVGGIIALVVVACVYGHPSPIEIAVLVVVCLLAISCPAIMFQVRI